MGAELDWLEVLLPGADRAQERERARALVGALAAWVVPTERGGRAAADRDALTARARALLEASDREDAVAAAEALVAASCAPRLGAASFASWPLRTRPSEGGALARYERSRAALPSGRGAPPAGPGPGEPARAFVPRLVAWLRRQERERERASDEEDAPRRGATAATWAVRATWALDGAAGALARWERWLGPRLAPIDPLARAEALADGAELCLDLGRPRRALALLRGCPRERAMLPRLVELLGWCEVLAGDARIGAAWLEEVPDAERTRARLPAPLVDLVRRAPWCAPLFGRRRGDAGRRTDVDADDSAWPHGLLAAALVTDEAVGETVGDAARAFVGGATGGTVCDDSASGEPVCRARWIGTGSEARACDARAFAERAGCSDPLATAVDGAPPSLGPPRATIDAARLAGAPQVRVLDPRDGDAATVRAMRGAFPMATAAAPLPADGPRGAVFMAFDHRLVPSDARLRALAAEFAASYAALRRARTPTVATRAAASDACVAEVPAPRTAPLVVRSGAGRELERAARALVDGVAALGSRRRWWLFVREPACESARESARGRAVVVVAGDGGAWRGADRALPFEADARDWDGAPTGADADRLGAVCAVFAGGEPRLATQLEPGEGVDGASRSGCYLPLLAGGGAVCVAVLALESPRRRDFHAPRVAAAARVARERGDELALAAACDALARRTGEDPLCAAFAFARGSSGRWFDALERDEPVGLVGPTGSGRRTLARCLHAARGSGPLRSFRALEEREAWLDALAHGARDETLLVERLDRSKDGVRLLEERAAAGGPRVLWTAASTPSGTDLEPLELAPLVADRGRVPELFGRLVERAAEREGNAAPTLDDAACALVWRGAWSGNLAELDRVARRVARDADEVGGAIGARRLEAAALAVGVALPARLPSRRPPRALLEAALRTTALSNGRANQRRAALYLGWDRDTVRARLREAGLLDPAAARARPCD